MSALASPVIVVGLGACFVASAAFALTWWREPTRRAARTAATRLGGMADVVFTAPLRGQGVGLRVKPPGVAVVRRAGDPGLVFGFEEVIGIELIFDGEVRARAFRGEPRRPLDSVRPTASQISVRLVFDDVRYPDFELELMRPDDGPVDPAPSVDAARKLFSHVEAIIRQPPAVSGSRPPRTRDTSAAGVDPAPPAADPARSRPRRGAVLTLRLNQVTLPVRDLARSERFYAGLGLNKIVSDAHYLRFEVGDGSATLSLEQVGEEVRTDGGAWLYFECDDLDERVAELTSAGYVFEAPATDQPWLWREAWLTDPDGRRLCLYHAGEMRRFPPWRIDGQAN